MINFSRMVLGASCVTGISLEIAMNDKIIATAIILQTWLLLEWIAAKNNKKLSYDPVLHDILPILAQIIVFYRTIIYLQ